MLRLFAALLVCLSLLGCGDKEKKSKNTKNNKTKSTLKNDPALVDPEGGEFTMEEALAGLKVGNRLFAKIQTSMGDIECELLPEVAPNTVANFVGLARGTRPHLNASTKKWNKSPFYDGLKFHRVLPGFLIQGGDPLGTGIGGPGYTIKDELGSKSSSFDKAGRLAMARSPYPNSAGSQFFITEVAVPSMNLQYTIFGQCSEGLDIARAIARVEKRGDPSLGRPANDVYIKHIEIFYK
jgi:peptidyl-prolyl cis-trans isomerase A (cyclophilin A)